MNVITNNNSKCAAALSVLHNVIDPEIGLNIVDLGLIRQLDFDDEENKIYCTMTLTTQFCPMGESITDTAKEILKLNYPEYEAAIELTFSPPWNYKMISAEGQEFLKER
jgi:metal-sulfur cluster biosynthetic enzyme